MKQSAWMSKVTMWKSGVYHLLPYAMLTSCTEQSSSGTSLPLESFSSSRNWTEVAQTSTHLQHYTYSNIHNVYIHKKTGLCFNKPRNISNNTKALSCSHCCHGKKQFHYRPEQALRVPGGWSSYILRQSAHKGGQAVSRTHWPHLPPPPENILVLISVTGWANPRAVAQPEGLWQWKIPVTPSGIEPATFGPVAHYLPTHMLTPMGHIPSSKTESSSTKKTSCSLWNSVTTVSWIACPLSLRCPKLIQSMPFQPIPLRSILILSSHLCSGHPNGFFPSHFPNKTQPYSMYSGNSFTQPKLPAMKLSNQLHLELGLRLCGDLTPLPIYTFLAQTVTAVLQLKDRSVQILTVQWTTNLQFTKVAHLDNLTAPSVAAVSAGLIGRGFSCRHVATGLVTTWASMLQEHAYLCRADNTRLLSTDRALNNNPVKCAHT